MAVASDKKAERLTRARSDDALLEIVDREDCTERDLLLVTENGHENDEIPLKETLDSAFSDTSKLGRYPVVWVSQEYPDGYKVPLVISHMRTWANAEPVSSMVQFLSRYALIDHLFHHDPPMVDEYRAIEKRSKKKGKKWPVYGIWPEGKHDGLVITRATWFLQRR